MLHSVLYWSLVGLVFAVALRALTPPRAARRRFRPYGRPTPYAKPGTTRLYGISAGQDDPEPGAGTKAGSRSPRLPGAGGLQASGALVNTPTHTTHPPTSNGGSHSTVWITSDAGDASSTGTSGTFGGNAA